MINIIEFINKENLTLVSVETLRKSDIIISYSKEFESLVDFTDLSCEVFFIDSFEEIDLSEIDLAKLADLNIKACELAISKSFEGKNVSLISNETLKFGFNNLIYQIASKYSQKTEIKILPTVSTVDYTSSIIGAPLDDFSAINFANYLIPDSEIINKIESSLKANFILAIYNPSSNKELFNKFKEITLEIRKNAIISIIDVADNSKVIINLDQLDETKIKESSFLIVGNKATYIEDDLMITPRSYAIKNEIISYTREFFEKYLNDESPRGFDHDCEYLPCHSDMEACDFCYCPFYPCGESSTGGKWIKDKNVWDCIGCTWIHKENVDNCIREGIKDILNEVEDLNLKKEELLRVRRECLLKTK